MLGQLVAMTVLGAATIDVASRRRARRRTRYSIDRGRARVREVDLSKRTAWQRGEHMSHTAGSAEHAARFSFSIAPPTTSRAPLDESMKQMVQHL